jgi:hypothetical protein
MGLPPYDEVQHILHGSEDLGGREDGKAVIPPGDGQLWWAGKELSKEKKLADYVGKNEKTTIIAKLQKRGGGAPVREAAVDEQTQKEMMAYAYRKQEEWKASCLSHAFAIRITVCLYNSSTSHLQVHVDWLLQKLEEADDDSYMNAGWADSNALKNRLQGTGTVGFGKLR